MSKPDFSVTQTVTIAVGASLSGASAKLNGLRLTGVATAATNQVDATIVTLVFA